MEALAADQQTVFWGLLAFAGGMLLVYSFSTLYHFEKDAQRKHRLKILDHMAIYFLIAGTYTPFVLRYLPRETALPFLVVLWTLVAIGVIYKLFFIDRVEWLSLALYLGMGWMIVFIAKPLSDTIPLNVFWWVLAGGLSYTIGVYFYANSKRNFYHAIWHIFVLGGTVLHYVSLYQSLSGT